MVTLLDVLEARERTDPGRVAFVADAPIGEVSTARFLAHVRGVAAALRALGARGRRVLVVGRASYLVEVAEKAAWWLGASVVGVDPTLPAVEIERAARAFDASVVVFADRAPAAASVASRFAVLSLDDDALVAGERVRAELPARVRCSASDEAFVVFTSGTTGTPKGIAYDHGQVMLAANAILEHVGPMRAGLERTVGWLPLYNLTAKSLSAVNLVAGIATHVVSEPKDLAAALARVEPDYVVLVPRVLEKIAAHLAAQAVRGSSVRRAAFRALVDAREPARLTRRLVRAFGASVRRRIFGRRIRFVVSGSAPLRADARRVLERLGVPVVDAYGVSECIVPVAMSGAGRLADATAGARVLPANTVRLTGDGEVCVRGAGVMRGYVGGDARDAFTADGFYRTGDLGTLDAHGRLTLHGRTDDAFKTSNGVKVHPSAIEAHYAECPLVEHVVVVGEGRPCLVALATLDEAAARARFGGEVDAARAAAAVEEWFRRAGDAGPRSHRIARVALVPAFGAHDETMTPSMKVRRRAVLVREAATIEALYAVTSAARESSGNSAGRFPTPPPLA